MPLTARSLLLAAALGLAAAPLLPAPLAEAREHGRHRHHDKRPRHRHHDKRPRHHRHRAQERIRIGWADADADGWNAGETVLGDIRRLPLDGLGTVNRDPAPWEKAPALERADGRALVLLSRRLDPRAPLEVLLHLHGFCEGYRQERSCTREDPVRDKDIDRFEEQLQASGHPQLVVLLPQGGLTSGFAPRGMSHGRAFPSRAFIEEVLGFLSRADVLPDLPAPALARVRRLIVSAHSGGGGALLELLEDPTLGPGRRPDEVVLFDAINGAREELPHYEAWLEGRLEEDRQALAARPGDEQQRYLAQALRFRAYHTRSRRYTPLHDDPGAEFPEAPGLLPLRQFLDQWFQRNAAELGGERSAAYTGLRQNYQVLETPRSGHNTMIGTGILRDALRALPPLPEPPPAAEPAPAMAARGAPEPSL